MYASMKKNSTRGLGLWCLAPLSTICQLYLGGQFYWRRKPEYLEKTTDLPLVTDNYAVSSTPPLSEIQTHNVNGDSH